MPICHALRAPPNTDAFLQRLRARLTQWDVALRLKKPQSYVSKCESGEWRIDATEVIAFADLYGVLPEDLVRGLLPET